MATEGGPGAVGPRGDRRNRRRRRKRPVIWGGPAVCRRIAGQPDFGRELTLARQRAGLTVREVARAVGIPASTTVTCSRAAPSAAPEPARAAP